MGSWRQPRTSSRWPSPSPMPMVPPSKRTSLPATATSQQAAAVEETVSNSGQMHASITQNASNSRQMAQMALDGASGAAASGKAVNETVAAMKAIAEKISIIQEIAHQTNLLALNAAI